MPHKHTRRKGDDDAKYVCRSRVSYNADRMTSFDLAPSVIAKPLPTHANASRSKTNLKNKAIVRRAEESNGYKHDDTPRAFARLMQFQASKKRQRSGFDDGELSKPSKKKRKAASSQDDLEQAQEFQHVVQTEIPKISPGERLADFAARVDQALPVGGLKTKGRVKIEGLKERQTKKEKKMQKMYAAWREEDARRKEKLEEQKELEEDAEAEMEGYGDVFANSKRKRRKAGDAHGEDDPWAELRAKREERKGLNDVVQAPPSFKAIPKEMFKVRNGAKVQVGNVPTAAGSLKRREELEEARREVIDRYRGMSNSSSGLKAR